MWFVTNSFAKIWVVCVCVCVCARARMRACILLTICVCLRQEMRMCNYNWIFVQSSRNPTRGTSVCAFSYGTAGVFQYCADPHIMRRTVAQRTFYVT
jgi:hypothetical protein